METNHYIILIALCSLVLISHVFNVVAKYLRIPSVLLLISLGALLKYGSLYFNVRIFEISDFVSFLGSIGLILIVLEGVLDLRIERKNIGIIRKSFGAALFILLLSVGFIASLFYFWFKVDLTSSLINAIPLAVISSAIVIPSIHHLSTDKRNFLTYEAIFSDILGIMLFNFVLTQGALSLSGFAVQTLAAAVISVIISYILVLLIYQMKTKTKVFIILSLLVLIYAAGKLFHQSSLLLVFVFGMILGNFTYLTKVLRLKVDHVIDTASELAQFKLIVDESAFLLRTFFFIAFGYSINVESLLSLNVLMVGVPIVLILLGIRFVYLNFIVRTHVFPELFIAPKGLITILLFYSIPQNLLIASISEGVLLFVIIATGMLMIIGGAWKYQSTE